MIVNLCAYYNVDARMFRPYEADDVLRRIKVHSPGPPYGMPVGEPVDDGADDRALCERVFRTLNRVNSDEEDIAYAAELGPMRAALADRSMCVGDVIIVTRADYEAASSTTAAYTVDRFGFAPIPVPSVASIREADYPEGF